MYLFTCLDMNCRRLRNSDELWRFTQPKKSVWVTSDNCLRPNPVWTRSLCLIESSSSYRRTNYRNVMVVGDLQSSSLMPSLTVPPHNSRRFIIQYIPSIISFCESLPINIWVYFVENHQFFTLNRYQTFRNENSKLLSHVLRFESRSF